MYNIKDKVAVVTGASSGLGADAAREYAKNNAKLALLARNKEKLEKVKKELEELGAEVFAVECDVTNESSVKNAIEEVINRFGRIDILLNNAGVAVGGGVDTLSVEDWEKSMDVNVKGIFLVSKYVIPHMKNQKYGKVVNISSINAMLADKADMFIRHSYNASKAAVIGLTRGMAVSYGQYGITVNAVCPGLFESGMTKDTLFKSEEFLKAYSYQNPMSRPGNKGELNGTIIYLSSDMSSYVTGQAIVVSGGFEFV